MGPGWYFKDAGTSIAVPSKAEAFFAGASPKLSLPRWDGQLRDEFGRCTLREHFAVIHDRQAVAGPPLHIVVVRITVLFGFDTPDLKDFAGPGIRPVVAYPGTPVRVVHQPGQRQPCIWPPLKRVGVGFVRELHQLKNSSAVRALG